MNERRDFQRKKMTLPVIAVVAVLILLLIIPHTADPILYTPKQDAESLLHDRLSVLRQLSQNNSGVIFPLMEDIISSSGTLVLNLKLKDFDSAGRDLDEYLARSRQFDNLVIKLDMSQSDLEEWRRLNARNKEDLLALFEDTERFSELKKLEIEYRDADNPDMLYSIMYEGEALKSKIKETVAAYEGRSEDIIRVSEKFGVKTTPYKESVLDSKDISREVSEEQEERSTVIRTEVPPKTLLGITLGIEPTEVRYGGTLAISGRMSGTEIRICSLYLDSKKLKEVTAAADGTFLQREKILKIRSGMHTLYATVDGAYSDVLSFRVVRIPTQITLENPGGQAITGRLMTDDIPVSGAPIRILSAGRQIATPITGVDGRFTTELKLSAGTHRIVAVFDDTSFPLDRVESSELEINILPPEETEGKIEEEGTAFILIVAVLFLVGAGGYWYLRRRVIGDSSSLEDEISIKDQIEVSEPEVDEEISPEEVMEEVLLPVIVSSSSESALDVYRVFEESDYSVALRHLFLSLAEISGMNNPKTVTTGDLCRQHPSDPRLLVWISLYDRVLYGGYNPDANERIWLLEEYRRIRSGSP